MRIIVLQGMPNTGKTSTLTELYGMLVPTFAVSHGDRVVLNSIGDFSETITYHSQKVFLYTMGDYPQKLRIAIRDAAILGIDIFICACSRMDNSLITELQKHRTAFISKTVTVVGVQQTVFNTADAQTIFNLI